MTRVLFIILLIVFAVLLFNKHVGLPDGLIPSGSGETETPAPAAPDDEEDAPSLPPAPDEEGTPVPQPPALDPDWHFAPGDLLPGSSTTHGDDGVTDASVVAPSMRFPFETGPAFSNSQIFGQGGGGYAGGWAGPGGSENDPANFDYAWRDNFCEVRTNPAKHANELCDGGLGHNGQDIRPATCENAVHWIVAPEDGHISWVGSISVNVFGAETGYIYKNLHVQKPLPDWVEVGAPVTKGQRIGRASDLLSASSRATTVHLHYEIHGGAEIDGAMRSGPLPPYSSLVEAYMDLVDDNPDQIAPLSPPADITKCTQPQWP